MEFLSVNKFILRERVMYLQSFSAIMRPSTTEPEKKVYECPECMERVVEPERPYCADCGVALTNLSKSRDR